MKNPFNLEYDEEQLEQARQQLIAEIQPHVQGEQVVTAGRFRRGGFGAATLRSRPAAS
jgi:hypothetical protein